MSACASAELAAAAITPARPPPFASTICAEIKSDAAAPRPNTALSIASMLAIVWASRTG